MKPALRALFTLLLAVSSLLAAAEAPANPLEAAGAAQKKLLVIDSPVALSADVKVLPEVTPDGMTAWEVGKPVVHDPESCQRLPDGTIYVSECHSARIRVIAPDRKSFRFITSPAMKHAATIVVVRRSADRFVPTTTGEPLP